VGWADLSSFTMAFIWPNMQVYVAAVPWISREFGNFTWQIFDEQDEVHQSQIKFDRGRKHDL
jgi:hypothetical protein